jgi:FkbM family methyltransferase
MTALDIGANGGSYAREMLRCVGPTGRVYAIEPDPRAKPVEGVHWLQLACADQDGTTTLMIAQEPMQNSLWAPNVPVLLERVDVRVARLDTLQAQGLLPDHIDVVKIDAQGAEVRILEHATRLLAGNTVWIVEVWHDGLQTSGRSAAVLFQHFEAAGYAGWIAESDIGQPPRPWPELQRCADGHRGTEEHLSHKSFDLVARRVAGV